MSSRSQSPLDISLDGLADLPPHRREIFEARLERWLPDLREAVEPLYDDPETVVQRLLSLAAVHRDRPAAEIIQQLHAAARRFSEGLPQRDRPVEFLVVVLGLPLRRPAAHVVLRVVGGRLEVIETRVPPALSAFDLSLSAESNDVSLYFDAACLEKVMFNLLSNAVKFSPRGSTVM